MAIAGAATQSFEAQIVDGNLIMKYQTLRLGVETDPKEAYRRLVAGEKIFLHSYHPTVEEVKRLFEEEKE